MSGRHSNVLVVTGDPGGARVLIPALELLRRRNPRWRLRVMAGPASRPLWRVGRFNTFPWPLSKMTYSQCRKLLSDAGPDLVITGTSFENPTESNVRLAAKRAGIPSYSVLDHWCNYRHRFEGSRGSLVLPDRIGVMDAFARQRMRGVGISDSCLEVVGHPVLEPFMKRRRLPVSRSDEVLFLSEPISWNGDLDRRVVRHPGHNELVILAKLLAVFEQQADMRRFRLRIRPHPLEPEQRIQRLISGTRLSGRRVLVSRSRPLEQDFRRARVVLGITSIALLQARLMGRPVLSLRSRGDRGGVPDDILCFLPSVGSNRCFIEAVSRFVLGRRTGKDLVSPGRRLSLPSNSSLRMARAMERLAGSAKGRR